MKRAAPLEHGEIVVLREEYYVVIGVDGAYAWLQASFRWSKPRRELARRCGRIGGRYQPGTAWEIN